MNILPSIGYNGRRIEAAWMVGAIDDMDFARKLIERDVYSGNPLRKLENYRDELYEIAPDGNLYEMTKTTDHSLSKILLSLIRTRKHDFAVVFGIGVDNVEEYFLGAFQDLWKRWT